MMKKKQKKGKKRTKKQAFFPYVKDLLIACGSVLVVLIIITAICFKGLRIEGYGMMPTLRNRDIVVAKRTKTIKRFDLVVLTIGNKQQVRRVVGLPDEIVRYQNDQLTIDGHPVDEKFIVDEINDSQRGGKAFTEDFISGSGSIPEDYYLVLGDNRSYATDSRHYGLIAKRNVIGVITMRLLPINDLKRF
ncbi:signal peptidase I [Enterococcus rotai]|uniref:signal peptidase I n=1 Tax=Enterococcus rotai TaxID=118060 RepID=UPI0032B33A82